jgi:hypothetical protein
VIVFVLAMICLLAAAIYYAHCDLLSAMPRRTHGWLDAAVVLFGMPRSRITDLAREGIGIGFSGNRVMTQEPRLVEVRKNILKQNDVVARELRAEFLRFNVVVSLVSSPGSGKTTFLEKILTLLRPSYRVAALVGDLATENDAQQLARSGAPVKQITTGTLCHLEAAMVRNALQTWDIAQLDFLFIENVGNLVCPSSYDLGENLRLVLTSVTERRR